MNDDRERIIEFDAATSIPADGWLAIDSSTEGTKKVQKSAIIGSGQLDTESQEVIGAINEVNARAATVVSMTQAEYDALPDTKLSDNIVRFITDGVPTVDQTLWNKVGTSTLNTTAQNCSDAINELKSNLVKYLKINNVITFASGSTGSGYKTYSFSDDDACKGKTILSVHAITSSVSGSATMMTDDRYFDSNTYGMVYSISSALPSEVKYSLVVAYI